ncbi:hypothetical protein UACE39S_04959 [Ureibacillus acetophenoni]
MSYHTRNKFSEDKLQRLFIESQEAKNEDAQTELVLNMNI